MGSNLFWDANVLLDLVLKREEYSPCRQLMELTIQGSVHSFTSPSILHIVGYWLTKAYGAHEARVLMMSLLLDVRVLQQNHEIALAALHSKITDFEDALQHETALHHKVDVFISRDQKLQGYSTSRLPVVNPTDFLRSIK
jgi:predicted nucleic acid-binding protein